MTADRTRTTMTTTTTTTNETKRRRRTKRKDTASTKNSATMTGKGRKTTTKIRPLRLCRRRRRKLPSKKQCAYSYRIYSSFTRVLFSFSFSVCIFICFARVSERHATATRARLNFHPPQNREKKQKQTNKNELFENHPPKKWWRVFGVCVCFYVASLTFQPLLSLTTSAVRTNSTLTDRSGFYKHRIRFGKCAVKSQTRSTFLAWFYSS